MTTIYNGFISYSHAADGNLAPALQSALQQLAKPWYRFRAVRIFCDQTNLSATPELWPSIERALSQSDYLILLASPEATQSPWINREVDWWLKHRTIEKILIVLTSGNIAWDNGAEDFDWTKTDALTGSLKGRSEHQPRYVDLRWVRGVNDLSLRHSRFRAAVLDLAATIHGKPKDLLDGDDVKQHGRLKKAAWTAILVITIAVVMVAWEAHLANQEKKTAISRQLSALALSKLPKDREISFLLAVESHHIRDTFESREALLTALVDDPRIVRFLHGHSSSINQILFSSTENRLISADNSVVVWQGNLPNLRARPLRIPENQDPTGLRNHLIQIGSLHLDRDSKKLMSVDGLGKALFWDLRSFATMGTLSLGVFAVPWQMGTDAAGDRISALGNDGRLHLWKVRGGRSVKTSTHRFNDMTARFAFAPDGRTVVTGEEDGTVTIWNGETLEPSKAFRMRSTNANAMITSLSFSPDSNKLAIAFGEGDVEVIDLKTRRNQPLRRTNNGGRIIASAFDSLGSTLALAAQNDIHFWNLGKHGDAESPLRGVPNGASVLAFSKDATYLAAGTKSGAVVIWKRDQRCLICKNVIEATDNTAATLSPNGHYIAFEQSEQLVLFDTTKNMVVSRSTRLSDQAHASTLAFDATTQFIARGDNVGMISVWARDTLRKLKGPLTVHTKLVKKVAFDSTGRLLISAGLDNQVKVLDANSLEVLLQFDGSDFALDRHNDLLAIVTTNQNVEFRALRTGVPMRKVLDIKEARKVAFGSAIVETVAFSPDGTVIATGDWGGSVFFWDADTGKILDLPFQSHSSWVAALAFSPDNSFIASIGLERDLRLWDARSRRPLGPPIKGVLPDQPVFSADGKTMLVRAPDVLYLWHTSPAVWTQLICAVATRNFSQEEWKQYVANEPYEATCARD